LFDTGFTACRFDFLAVLCYVVNYNDLITLGFWVLLLCQVWYLYFVSKTANQNKEQKMLEYEEEGNLAIEELILELATNGDYLTEESK
jgi:hypothetical protein